ncbi:MAG TPA: SLC13 family permease [Bacteroidales bacterium]|jgi:Na+/H+ antiporter NhaD/arsenite permease-like protein|nr:SLC13 family permease [Bacteroidales bacterium]HQQ03105.1 SLC13 family permease [Bacteroidales bacterium]
MEPHYIALIIFILTYIGIIFTRLPGVNIDRPSAAFFGAIAMILFGILSFDEAISAIDFNTIGLLLGMMIIIATLQLDGFFAFLASQTIRIAQTPFKLLIAITLFTGITSAFLVNDAVVLFITPLIISLCKSGQLNPIPFLIAEILAANTGSLMTMTGNPQNMLIGINSGIPYAEFLLRLIPISLLGLVIIILVIRLLYNKTFSQKNNLTFDKNAFQYNFRSMQWSVIILAGVVIMFFIHHLIHLSIPLISLTGAALILIFGKVKPSKVIKQIDWVLLLFFASLFVVVHGVEKVGLFDRVITANLLLGNAKSLAFIHVISLFLSQLISNVPLTVIMLPLMKTAGNEILWLGLASATTLAGNATIIGAMANLIVIESAQNKGIKISFMDFFKPGIIVSLSTLLISLLVLIAQL